MKLWRRINSIIRNLFQKQQVENQLDDEIGAYVDMMTDERIAAGMSASETRRTALAEFGGIEQTKQAVREHRAGASVELLWQDARYGLRQFWRNPGFTVTVILTLALSIGVNTAIFSMVNALMLKSLPYSHPERMGTIYTRITDPMASDGRHHLNGEQWVLLRDNVPALISAVSSIRTSGVNLEAGSPYAVSSGGTHLRALPRRPGNPSHHRPQFFGCRGSSTWIQDGYFELWLVAQHLRL